MFNKIKKFFGKKAEKVYSGEDLTPKGFSYVLMLSKDGKVDEEFNAFIKLILNKLEDARVTSRSFTSEISGRVQEFITQGEGYCKFELPFSSNLSEEVGKRYNLVKKELQSLIEQTPKYKKKTYILRNLVHYKLNDQEKKIPIDFDKLLLDLHQEISHIRVNIYKQDALPKDEMVKIVNETLGKGMDWYVAFNFNYVFYDLNDDFFDKIKKISAYLVKNKFIVRELSMSDVKKRYADAISDYENNLLNGELPARLKKTGVSDSKIKQIVRDFATNIIPKIYIFQVSCVSIEVERFKKMQEELFKKINLDKINLDYGLALTTDPNTGSNYGCYINFRPDAIKE